MARDEERGWLILPSYPFKGEKMKLSNEERQKLKKLIHHTYHTGYRDDIDELYNIYEELDKILHKEEK